MSEAKQRWPRAEALAVAKELIHAFTALAAANRIEVAGSLRRLKPTVGDIELLYIPRIVPERDPSSLLAEEIPVDLSARLIGLLERQGILARRLNALGREAMGERNKLMIHAPSGIPVDLFATTEEAWFNYLVCRTGGADSNTRIAMAARQKGWQWCPYDAGFRRLDNGALHRVASEREVFDFVGLPYLDPCRRT